MVVHSLGEVSIGAEAGLHEVILARSRRSVAYVDWDKK